MKIKTIIIYIFEEKKKMSCIKVNHYKFTNILG